MPSNEGEGLCCKHCCPEINSGESPCYQVLAGFWYWNRAKEIVTISKQIQQRSWSLYFHHFLNCHSGEMATACKKWKLQRWDCVHSFVQFFCSISIWSLESWTQHCCEMLEAHIWFFGAAMGLRCSTTFIHKMFSISFFLFFWVFFGLLNWVGLMYSLLWLISEFAFIFLFFIFKFLVKEGSLLFTLFSLDSLSFICDYWLGISKKLLPGERLFE